MMINVEYLTHECSLDAFVALLRFGVTDDLPDAAAVARHYLGFAFEGLVQNAETFNGLTDAVWLGVAPQEVWLAAPHQERTDVIRKALAIAYGLDPSDGVLWGRELPVGWMRNAEGQPASAWVLRTSAGAVMFSADPDFMPCFHTAGMVRTSAHAPAVEAASTPREALIAAIQHKLSDV